jgi:cyanate permease
VLVGISISAATLGGAIGPWMAGKIFDASGSYHAAFLAGIAASAAGVIGALLLMRRSNRRVANVSGRVAAK